MPTTPLLVLLLLAVTGLLVTVVPGHLVWRPRLGIPLAVAAAFGALVLTAILSIAALPN
ncbi:hypothetical protein [Streptomyces sp.]|uniref:hypothetical protein n=1 Tax=Streptomyces sp. TaxID=1931 RepID=UPI002810EB0C|nr:hypothetical protein [Streptomyces sp.]